MNFVAFIWRGEEYRTTYLFYSIDARFDQYRVFVIISRRSVVALDEAADTSTRNTPCSPVSSTNTHTSEQIDLFYFTAIERDGGEREGRQFVWLPTEIPRIVWTLSLLYFKRKSFSREFAREMVHATRAL